MLFQVLRSFTLQSVTLALVALYLSTGIAFSDAPKQTLLLKTHSPVPIGYSIERHHQLMEQAIALSKEGPEYGGGPFGAVIVNDQGRELGSGYNHVAIENDPTAHGEVTAIRDACKKTGQFDLHGATLYTSTFPCPLCFSAAHWANIKTIYYANHPIDVASVFDDATLWKAIMNQGGLMKQTYPMAAHRKEAQKAFQDWKTKMEQGTLKNYNPSLENTAPQSP